MNLLRVAIGLVLTVVLGGGLVPRPGMGLAEAGLPTVSVMFANIERMGDDGWPVPGHPFTVQGVVVDGRVMVRMQHLAAVLGASLSREGNVYRFTRNGQVVTFTIGQTGFNYAVAYSLTDPASGSRTDYLHQWHGSAPVAPRMVGLTPYVYLSTAALSLGALLVLYNDTIEPARAEVYDWRIRRLSPLRDPNVYVSGGRWLAGWEDMGEVMVSPHFAIGDNLWDRGEHGGIHHRQFKLSATTLQSLENTLALADGRDLVPTNAFRSWIHNSELAGSWSRSFHMRGRAFDIGDRSLYEAVTRDLAGPFDQPEEAGSFWRTRNPESATGLYEIETMPTFNSFWLHGQREPGTDQALYGP